MYEPSNSATELPSTAIEPNRANALPRMQEIPITTIEPSPTNPLARVLQGMQDKVFGADRSISAMFAGLGIMLVIVSVLAADFFREKRMGSQSKPDEGETTVSPTGGYVVDTDSEEPESLGKFGDGIPEGGGGVRTGEIPVSASIDAMEQLDIRQSDAVTNQLSSVSNTLEEFEPDEYSHETNPDAKTSGPQGSPKDGPDEKTRLKPLRSPELRWSIFYATNQTLSQYARTLDEFRIELGVLKSGKLKVLSQMSADKPTVRNATGDDKRMFFRWQDEGRKKADKELARLAGLIDENLLIVHYIPSELEQTLIRLEAEAAKAKSVPVSKIKKTKFGIKKDGNRREFYVMSIEF